MIEKTRAVVRKYGAKVALVPVTLGAALPALADDPTVASSITSAQTEILGYVAAWGAAFIAVALAGVGWRVGGKLIKRMGGAA